jgi:3,4-dihydroxy 2-butanone 4-phosphate synthase/GTP cyclohydrolase II
MRGNAEITNGTSLLNLYARYIVKGIILIMDRIRVNLLTCARVPTAHGEFQVCLYNNSIDDKEHLALIKGSIEAKEDVLVRIHSECFTGDVLHSERCDCGEQLHFAMQAISNKGEGVILYLRQEGRGIGLLDKLRAYNLQDEGYDTVEANLLLGHHPDERDYGIAAAILEDLEVRSIHLMTNNPHKINALKELGFNVSQRVPIQAPVTKDNAEYLETKRLRMKHMLPTNGRSIKRTGMALEEHDGHSA